MRMEMETIMEWRAPEHHFEKRTTDWYWMLGIVALAGAVLSFYFGNMLFAIFIVLSAVTLGTLSYRETKEVETRVTPKGIVVGKYLYAFRSQRSFWIEDDHVRGPRILLHPLNSFMPLITIPIAEEVDLDDLREILMQFLDEEFLEESLVHKLLDKVGL